MPTGAGTGCTRSWQSENLAGTVGRWRLDGAAASTLLKVELLRRRFGKLLGDTASARCSIFVNTPACSSAAFSWRTSRTPTCAQRIGAVELRLSRRPAETRLGWQRKLASINRPSYSASLRGRSETTLFGYAAQAPRLRLRSLPRPRVMRKSRGPPATSVTCTVSAQAGALTGSAAVSCTCWRNCRLTARMATLELQRPDRRPRGVRPAS